MKTQMKHKIEEERQKRILEFCNEYLKPLEIKNKKALKEIKLKTEN